MYIAQFAIGQDVIVARRWEEVQYIFEEISRYYNTSRNKRFVVYVHNLGFEFQFIRNFFEWEEVFAVKKRVPVKALTVDGIEFRCSWKLTNMSLARFCEKTPNVLHKKQSGEDFDYSKIRTPDDELTDMEYYYCACDVLGLHEAIDTLLLEDSLASIPMTSTGYVRRDCRKAVLSNPSNRDLIKECYIDSFLYTLLRTARRGGDCAASDVYSSHIISNVDSYDIKSSYPYVMEVMQYPMGQWRPDSGKVLLEDRCYLMVIELFDICVKDINIIGYIPFSKCTNKRKYVNCNGRIIKADYVKMVITEVDYKIIQDRYSIGDVNICASFSCRKGFLPVELRKEIMHYYQLKTDLDGVDSYLYMKSKNKLNAIFGMMLTDITNSDIVYDGEWKEEQPDVNKQLESYFNSRKSFLAYQWGVWVVAYARYRLHEVYMNIYNYAIYCDTDSWKVKQGYRKEYFDCINSAIIQKAEDYDIKPYAFKKDGSKEYLGVWEFEGTYDKFITLGAKKYCTEKKGKCSVTVSGLSKERGAAYLDSIGGIEMFKDSTTFPVKHSGRTVMTYDDTPDIYKLTVNGSTFTTSSSVACHDTTYTLDRSSEYIALLDAIDKYGLENIN